MIKNKIQTIVITILMICTLFNIFYVETTEASDWYSGWTYSRKIIIDHTKVSGTLNNFPVLVSATLNSSHVQSDGDDILFTSSTGTKLNHEIENYNNGTGVLVAWVNITSLSSSADTIVYMYYGNATCSSQQNSTGVWDSDYIAVYHFGDEYDSTSNGRTLTNDGGAFVPGVVGNCVDLENDDTDYLYSNSFYDFKTESAVSIETWGYVESVDDSGDNCYVGIMINYFDSGQCILLQDRSNSDKKWEFGGQGTGIQIAQTTGVWTYLTGTITEGPGGAYKLYEKGTLAGSTTGGSTWDDMSSDNIEVGKDVYSSRYFDGMFDELRISKSIRSWDWHNASYNNMNSPSTFMTFGDEKEAPIVVTDDATNVEETTVTLNGNLTDDGGENCTVWFEYGTNTSYGNSPKYTIEVLTSGSGNWVVPDGVTKIDVLVVAGGGGSGKGLSRGNRNAGGGGAGGLIWITNVTQLGSTNITGGNTISYSVGTGGAGSTSLSSKGGTGVDSIFGNLTAKGGGGGGSTSSLPGNGGGSGGGAGAVDSTGGAGGSTIQSSQVGWSGTYGHGNAGATTTATNGGGGGGAGSAGTVSTGGAGMDFSSFFGTTWGNSGVFASGGGAHEIGPVALANSGMGGRAPRTDDGGNGNAGGSGIILINYSITSAISNSSIEYYLVGLSPGTLYHYRAAANNSGGTSYGSDKTFLTKPEIPTDFSADAYSISQINLTWTKGTGANNTYIESLVNSSSLADELLISQEAGTSYGDFNGLVCRGQTFTPTETMFLTKCGMKLRDNSVNPVQLYVTVKAVDANHFPTGDILSQGSITQQLTTTATWYNFTMSLAKLEQGTEYAYYLTAPASADTVDVVTESNVYSGGIRIYSNNGVSWTAYSADDQTFRIYGSTWSLGEGTMIYNGTGTNYEDAGCLENTTYYYKAWSYSEWDDLHQWSDNYVDDNEYTVLYKIDEHGVLWNIKPFLHGSSSYLIPTGVTKIDVLVVGGGGGSGEGDYYDGRDGGGGGAGGLIWMQNVTTIGGIAIGGNPIAYSVGIAGAGATSSTIKGYNGGDSTFGNLTAKGGGGAGSSNSRPGANGGSGGGAGVSQTNTGAGGITTQSSQVGWSGTYGHGYAGAASTSSVPGGGGGAGSAGSGRTGGAGMDMSSFFGTTWGNSGVFASGGGGTASYGAVAVVNSGMGGRSRATSDGYIGNPGGSGIIFVRWTHGVFFEDENPVNNSIDITGLLTNWSIYIYDVQNQTTSGTIECSNGDNMNWNDEGDGIKTLTFTEWLDYNTTYYVWVNATNGNDNLNEIYNFKTTTCKITGTVSEDFWGGIYNVKIVANGTTNDYTTYTDNNGDYEFDNVVYGTGVTYNITASKFAYTFSPEYRNEDLTRNVTDIDFTGTHFFYGGTGIQGDPFTIENCTHLNNIRLFPNYAFVLNNDLNMSECGVETWNGGKGFEPLCNESTHFTGTFDGGGYIISNLFINYSDMDYIGLFGYIENSDIRNLGLEQINITGGNYTGSLAGYIDNTSILMCFAYSNTTSITGNNHTGGLIGLFNDSSIQDSYARVETTGNNYVGGLIGQTTSESLVNKTYATGTVVGNAADGGLIGDNGNDDSTIINSFYDNETSGQGDDGKGVGKNTSDMTSLDFWDTTEFSFPDIWFLDENQNDIYPILSIFTEITPPLLREVNRAGSLTQQIYRYLNASYNPEDYCFFNITAYVPQERYAGRWNKNVSDGYFIATGIEEPDWTDTKDNYVIATRIISTYTGYYDQMRVFTVWHGHYPSTLGGAICADANGEPGELLGYTDAWNLPVERDSIWFPDYSHVWLTLNLTDSVLMAKDTAYWLLIATNDSSMWRESYSMPGSNLSGMSDYIWTLGNTIGDTSNVKMLPYNVTLNIPNKEYVDPYEGTEWEGLYGYWIGDVQNSTFSWEPSFEGLGWQQGKDITSTNLSQLLIYALSSVDVSHVDISNVQMTWGTGYEDNIIWSEPVNMSRVSPDLNYWEYNKTNIPDGNWNTWKVILYDEFGNVESYDYYRWMKHGETERIYFQCNVSSPPEGVKYLNSTTNLYSDDWVFYLYEAQYDDTPEVYGDNEGRKQALRHEQGVDGSAYDTGYWTTEIPTDLYQERTCAFFVGGVWDQDVVIPDSITIDNAFVSWWTGSGRQLVNNATDAAQNIHWGRTDTEASFDEYYIRDYGHGAWEAVTYDGLEDTIAWQDMPLTRRFSNDWINFNESTWYDPPLFDNSTGRISDRMVRQVVQKLNFSLLAGTEYPNTFDSNSIYQLFTGMDYDAMWSSGANAIIANNISHPSFIIFNIPEDSELCITDSNDDGITDYEALYLYGLQPFSNDTDNDTFTDIQELSRDTGANLYRDYPSNSNIILIKDMNPFEKNSTDDWSTTFSVTIDHPQDRTMTLKWYVLKNFTFNSSYINQDQLLEGTWELVQTNSSISDGTYILNYTLASENYWAVNASDESGWWGNRSSMFYGPNRQLNGTVTKDGTGVENVNVTARNNNTGKEYYDYTDVDGNYLIQEIPDGDYVVTPVKNGCFYIPQHRSITISMENYTGVNFEGIDAPQYSAEYPYNGSSDVDTSVIWSVLITYENNFDWSIECSDGNSSSDTNDTTGRKNLSLSNLEYNTWYTVWVNSSHVDYSHVKTNTTYYFKVKEDKTSYPGMPIDFTAIAYSENQINLTWTKGINATNTYIRYNAGNVSPMNRDTGTFLYNATGTNTILTELPSSTEYSFSAWSWNATYNSWSYLVIDNATTESEPQEPDYLDISILPALINFGLVDVGAYTQTENYYFDLTNNGMSCNIEIDISNSLNWTFVNYTDRGHDKFSMNLSKDNWMSEENIKTDGTSLVVNLIWQDNILFDIKMFMPTSLSHLGSSESTTLTFTATPS